MNGDKTTCAKAKTAGMVHKTVTSDQGLRHADENGGGGTGTRRQRSQDFLQRVTHTKNRKLSGFGPLFSLKWGDYPRTLKNGGRVPPPVPPVAEPLLGM